MFMHMLTCRSNLFSLAHNLIMLTSLVRTMLSIQTMYTYTGIASEGQAVVSKVNLCYINKGMRKIKLKKLFITGIK